MGTTKLILAAYAFCCLCGCFGTTYKGVRSVQIIDYSALRRDVVEINVRPMSYYYNSSVDDICLVPVHRIHFDEFKPRDLNFHFIIEIKPKVEGLFIDLTKISLILPDGRQFKPNITSYYRFKTLLGHCIFWWPGQENKVESPNVPVSGCGIYLMAMVDTVPPHPDVDFSIKIEGVSLNNQPVNVPPIKFKKEAYRKMYGAM